MKNQAGDAYHDRGAGADQPDTFRLAFHGAPQEATHAKQARNQRDKKEHCDEQFAIL